MHVCTLPRSWCGTVGVHCRAVTAAMCRCVAAHRMLACRRGTASSAKTNAWHPHSTAPSLSCPMGPRVPTGTAMCHLPNGTLCCTSGPSSHGWRRRSPSSSWPFAVNLRCICICWRCLCGPISGAPRTVTEKQNQVRFEVARHATCSPWRCTKTGRVCLICLIMLYP